MEENIERVKCHCCMDKFVTLSNGISYVPKIMFMNNSSWIICRKYKIGVKIAQPNSNEVKIKEAICDTFFFVNDNHRECKY